MRTPLLLRSRFSRAPLVRREDAMAVSSAALRPLPAGRFARADPAGSNHDEAVGTRMRIWPVGFIFTTAVVMVYAGIGLLIWWLFVR